MSTFTSIVLIIGILALLALCVVAFKSRKRCELLCENNDREQWELRRQLQLAEKDAETQRSEKEQSNLLQTNFLELLSHEMRTPLHAVGNYASFIREDLSGTGQIAVLSQVTNLERHIGKLSRLIEQIEILAKLNHNNSEFAPVSFSLLVAGKAYLFKGISQENNIQFDWNPGTEELWIRGVESSLRVLLDNVLENALTACSQGGTITATLMAQPASVLLEIKDSGVGLAMEDLEKLFAPFSKTQSSMNDHRDGSGLGLYLCRQVVFRHGGKINLTSAGLGKGTTVTIELPRYWMNPPGGSI
ncbi:MAG: HAMP domain-containing histidine kinase [bacterium]|nr:HAMP domain-containing histidine kinase [bacterium]